MERRTPFLYLPHAMALSLLCVSLLVQHSCSKSGSQDLTRTVLMPIIGLWIAITIRLFG